MWVLINRPQACGTAPSREADFPQPLNQASLAALQRPIPRPCRPGRTPAQPAGSPAARYEQGGRITGPFDMAGGRVTGTEQFRFDRSGSQRLRRPRPCSREHR